MELCFEDDRVKLWKAHMVQIINRGTEWYQVVEENTVI